MKKIHSNQMGYRRSRRGSESPFEYSQSQFNKESMQTWWNLRTSVGAGVTAWHLPLEFTYAAIRMFTCTNAHTHTPTMCIIYWANDCKYVMGTGIHIAPCIVTKCASQRRCWIPAIIFDLCMRIWFHTPQVLIELDAFESCAACWHTYINLSALT